MSNELAIEMYIGGLLLDPNTQAPVIVLKDESGSIHLPIWIGIAEATSIASAIKQLKMARPLTHDLIFDMLNELGVRVERMVITELRDSTYFAELILSHGDKALILDSRPSDAIAIAVRAQAPIFVTQQVLDQAKITFATNVTQGENFPKGEDGAENPGEQSQSQDFKSIDRDKWAEILAELEADDFKYKM